MSEQDGWSIDGSNIQAPQTLAAIKEVLQTTGPIIVEHWFYYGSRSPSWLTFEDYETFFAYVTEQTSPGDAFDVWSFAEVCKISNTLASGKVPDKLGRVPARGAY